MLKVFIDGQAGTTGLMLVERLASLKDKIQIIEIDPELRKDVNEKKKLLNQADAVFLCLPAEASIESVALIDNPNTVILDASTAHRVNPDWVYGFPELSDEQLEAVKTANKITVPGCHSTGFIALINPLVKAGIVSKDAELFCHSLTGYSGGGNAMIQDYESDEVQTSAAWMYGLGFGHKHLPEMKEYTGLAKPPIFVPVVVSTSQGLIITVPLQLPAKKVHETLEKYYEGQSTIEVMALNHATSIEVESDDIGPDELKISVFGDEHECIAVCRLDNLGKGSSGAAVQCLKVRFGLS